MKKDDGVDGEKDKGEEGKKKTCKIKKMMIAVMKKTRGRKRR